MGGVGDAASSVANSSVETPGNSNVTDDATPCASSPSRKSSPSTLPLLPMSYAPAPYPPSVSVPAAQQPKPSAPVAPCIQPAKSEPVLSTAPEPSSQPEDAKTVSPALYTKPNPPETAVHTKPPVNDKCKRPAAAASPRRSPKKRAKKPAAMPVPPSSSARPPSASPSSAPSPPPPSDQKIYALGESGGSMSNLRALLRVPSDDAGPSSFKPPTLRRNGSSNSILADLSKNVGLLSRSNSFISPTGKAVTRSNSILSLLSGIPTALRESPSSDRLLGLDSAEDKVMATLKAMDSSNSAIVPTATSNSIGIMGDRSFSFGQLNHMGLDDLEDPGAVALALQEEQKWGDG